MKRRYKIFLFTVSIVLVFFTHGLATVEWKLRRTLKMEASPLDVAVALSGKWIFVLTEQGSILVYSADGILKDKLVVGNHIDGIRLGRREDILFVTSRKNKTVQIIHLDFIHDIDVSGSPFKGPIDAPVVIAVFNDFQCGYCAKLLPLLDQVLEEYPKRVKLVYKNFPLRNHRFARKAAIAAFAAKRQGKFWQFHDLLFSNARQLSDQKIREIARELGLNEEVFEKDMKHPEIRDKISRDVSDGKRAGVTRTPTILINGRLFKNRTTLEGFRAAIARELQKVGKKDAKRTP